MTEKATSVVMTGATGAVGSHVVRTLAEMPGVDAVTLLGRRPLEGVAGEGIRQYTVDLGDTSSYRAFVPGHDAAICTLGVGQPSKVTREEFVRIDKLTVLAFAAACKQAGIRHFELLGSVGAGATSKSFYLRIKGELEEGLRELGFDRLSIFRPSMILTPTNRYGLSQALTLAIWPSLNPILRGGLTKYRGIRVDRLGRAMALNVSTPGAGEEILEWPAIDRLAGGDTT